MNPIDDQTRPALARGVRIQTDRTTGEPMLLFPEGVLYLSPTAHDIALRCDGQRTTAAIISALEGEYDAELGALRGDVIAWLGELAQKRLLVLLP